MTEATIKMNCDNLVASEWRLIDRQTHQFGEGGRPSVLIKGQPFWRVKLDYLFPRVNRDKFMIQSAQFQSLESGAVEIALFRASRMNPQNFNADGVSLGSFAIDENNNELTLTASGNTLAVGDMIAYDANTSGRYIGEIVGIPSANNFNMRPKVITESLTDNVAIYQAAGNFRMIPNSLRIMEPIGPGPAEISAEFEQVSPYA